MTDDDQPDEPSQSKSDIASVFVRLAQSSAPAQSDQIAELESRIQEVENKLHEERFVWIICIVVLFDCLLLTNSDNWAAPLVIGFLELIALVVLAARCRVDAIMPLLDRLGALWPRGER